MKLLSTERRAILANFSWLMIGYLLVLGVGWIVQVWAARYLGPERLGLLSFAISLVMLVLPIAGLGLESIVTRELVDRPSSASKLLGSAVLLSLCGAAVAFIGMIVIAWLWRSDDPASAWLITVVALALLPRAWRVAHYWFSARVESRYAVVARLAALVLASCIRIVLIVFEAPLIAFAWAFVLESAIEYTVLFWMLRRHPMAPGQWRVSVSESRALLADSWPMILAGLAAMLYMQIDQVMLKVMIGDHAVGVYAPAVMVFNAVNAVSVAVVSSIFPAMVRLQKKNTQLYHVRIQQIYNVATWGTFPVAFVLCLASPMLMPLLFGSDYDESGPITAVLIFNCVFVAQGLVGNRYLVVNNRQVYQQYACVAAAVLNVILNGFFIPRFGAIGAAYATLLSYPTASTFGLLPFARARSIIWWQCRAWAWPVRVWMR